jgi:hypothetical protein
VDRTLVQKPIDDSMGNRVVAPLRLDTVAHLVGCAPFSIEGVLLVGASWYEKIIKFTCLDPKSSITPGRWGRRPWPQSHLFLLIVYGFGWSWDRG